MSITAAEAARLSRGNYEYFNNFIILFSFWSNWIMLVLLCEHILKLGID